MPGHAFEALSIRWLREAGFDLRDQRADGRQFGFEAAGGRLRGHIDGVIVAGPEIGVRWPALWEHKALNAKSWTDLVKRGLRLSKPIYFAQVQLYMAYMELGVALFTALNKDSQALHHEIVPFEPAEAQALSDRAVAIIRAADAGELPPRMASAADFYLCRMCAWSQRCWEQSLMTFSPSSEQARAIAGIKDWFWHRRGEQQVFRLFGYAGSGKSTLTAHAIAELGLDGDEPRSGDRGGVLYAAFTGKAALVMTRKGTPASTIHSLIYRCSEATPEEIARVEQDLQDLRAGLGAMGPGERLFAETQIRQLELRLARPARAALPAQRAVAAARCRSPRARRGLDGRRTRWPPTCWPSASRSWCSAIPGSCRRSRARAPSPTASPT